MTKVTTTQQAKEVWLNVYANREGGYIVVANDTEAQGRSHMNRENYIDTVEVEINFVDRRGV